MTKLFTPDQFSALLPLLHCQFPSRDFWSLPWYGLELARLIPGLALKEIPIFLVLHASHFSVTYSVSESISKTHCQRSSLLMLYVSSENTMFLMHSLWCFSCSLVSLQIVQRQCMPGSMYLENHSCATKVDFCIIIMPRSLHVICTEVACIFLSTRLEFSRMQVKCYPKRFQLTDVALYPPLPQIGIIS